LAHATSTPTTSSTNGHAGPAAPPNPGPPANAPSPGFNAGTPGGELALCPYCGHRQSNRLRCERCKGLFEPLSRQATQNAMGPWYIRDEQNPFRPGCSYEKLRDLASKGRVQRDSIIRGPTTRQFWTLACNTPGVAVLLGECHNCHRRVDTDDYMCKSCGTILGVTGDRQHLGLAPIKLLPGEAPPAQVASSVLGTADRRPHGPISRSGSTTAAAPMSGEATQVATEASEATSPAPISASARFAERRRQARRDAVRVGIAAFIGVLVMAGAIAAIAMFSPGAEAGAGAQQTESGADR